MEYSVSILFFRSVMLTNLELDGELDVFTHPGAKFDFGGCSA